MFKFDEDGDVEMPRGLSVHDMAAEINAEAGRAPVLRTVRGMFRTHLQHDWTCAKNYGKVKSR